MVVYDAETLDEVRNTGQTAGHCFDTYQPFMNSMGSTIFLETGDNYPRGMQIHEIKVKTKDGETSVTRTGRMVYTFKTSHATSATSRDYEFWFTEGETS